MILVVSGATGGHLYPALALTTQLNERSFYVVSRQFPAKNILDTYNQPFQVVRTSFKSMVTMPFKTLWLLIRKKPRVILLMGGQICVPFALMGWIFRIPLISFEQNTIPGRATRFVQYFVNDIITTFESTKSRLKSKSKVQCLGNPIRINGGSSKDLPDKLNDIKGNTLLVIGGSQGAKGLNQFIEKGYKEILASGMNIIHLTGDTYFKNKPERQIFENHQEKVYIAMPYIENMNRLFKLATHVICRAGATTLSELLMYGLPSILVPFPYSKDDHQVQNATEFANAVTNATVILEKDLSLENYLNTASQPKFNHQTSQQSPHKINNSICEFIQSYLK